MTQPTPKISKNEKKELTPKVEERGRHHNERLWT